MPKAAIEVPSQELLLQHFAYDPETGVLDRIGEAGSAGSQNSSGYKTVSFQGQGYLVHRIIWQMVYGDVNGRQVDHANGVKTDNRLVNLRPASDQTNSWNKGLRKSKLVPFKGVTVDRRNGRFKAHIVVNGRRVSLGRYDRAEDAAEAYRAASVKRFGFFANSGTFSTKQESVAAVAQSFEAWRKARA